MWGLFRGSGSEQRPRDQSPPISQAKELNPHVYELYKPTTGDVNVEILFFHGLQLKNTHNAYLSTWTSGDESKQVWPQTWLAQEFPKAHILSISYDSSMKTSLEGGRSDLFNLAENLINAICLANIGQGSCRPVILVGHSFGGLVIKKVCVEAHHQHSHDPGSRRNKMLGQFLHNVGLGGIFFYGTPHHGSSLANMATHFLNGPLLVVAQTLSAEAARLETEFDSVRKKHKIGRTPGVGELLPTKWGPCNCVIVPEASARYGAEFCTVKENHISLCKPTNTTSISFQNLVTFIQSIKVQGEGVQGEVCAPPDNNQWIPKEVVGLELALETVKEKLKSATHLGIVGMGGVGKTTLAKAIFNKLGPTFEYTCFVPDVKLIIGSVADVKKEVWKHMHYQGKKLPKDKEDSWHALRGARLLLVLDDVAKERDLKVLSEITDNNGAAKNCTIVTSRDQDLLNCLDDVYKVPFLRNEDAKQLFLSNAFLNQAQPPPTLEAHVDNIVKKCDGLPLTLEVLGKYLRNKDSEDIWKQSLEALEKASEVSRLDEKVWAKLSVSYNSLGEKEQQMFLDATTFFREIHEAKMSWRLREAKAAWSMSYGLEDVRWQTLVDMSLVYDVGEDDNIRMHEQLQSLGRRIASTTNKHGKRVWDPDFATQIFPSRNEEDGVVEEIVALKYSVHKLPILVKVWNDLSGLRNLQLLDVYSRGVILGPSQQMLFPSNLALLGISGFNSEFGRQLPFNPSSLKRLVVLKLEIYELECLPSSFGQLSALKTLFIRSWELKRLPESFGQFSRLEHLDIHCLQLRTLPASFGKLSALKILVLNCGTLCTLPKTFGQLSALKTLFISTLKMEGLPESFGQLSRLEHLDIKCDRLRTLSASFGQLGALEKLRFDHCEDLIALPDSFGLLASLKRLTFLGCKKMSTLPEPVCRLAALEHLSFEECESLHALPESLGGLSALKHLEISIGSQLSALPNSIGQLAQLEHLTISECESFEWLPDSVGELVALQYLRIEWAPLKCLPDWIEGLPSLQTLVLTALPHLEGFPSWLGDGTPPRNSRQTFRVQEGHFVLTQERKLDLDNKLWRNYHRWALAKVRTSDYAGALALLPLVGLGNEHSQDGLFFQERGIIKRMMGDLDGALEDLNVALDKIGQYPWEQLDHYYHCTMHRGFVKYLKGDIEGARADGEKALEIPNSSPWPSPSLGEQPVEYLNFRLIGMKEINDLQLLIRSMHSQEMDKAKAMDYTGALADLNSIDLETTLLHSPAFALAQLCDRLEFVLQERGVLKRLMGDLDGALKDLTAGLEIAFEKGEDDYEHRKHRGYVKYLKGDLEGARNDAQQALKIKPSRVDDEEYAIQVLEGGGERLKFLGGESLNYLEFNLK